MWLSLHSVTQVDSQTPFNEEASLASDLYLEGLDFRFIGRILGVSNVSILNWIWIAVRRYGRKFINFVIGDRSNETAIDFWKTINQHEMKYITNDYWKHY